MKNEKLIIKARELRLKVLEDIYRSKKGHIGGTYSVLDIFIYMYYGDYGLQYYTDNKKYENRDRLIVGKGHACLALYNIWEDLGIIEKNLINEYGNNGSFLGGQLNVNTLGVEYNTGSLGHAVGIASGIAIACNLDKKKYFSIALIGDGECSEGSIWESIDFAGQQKLNKLMCIVDHNKLGVTDFINNIKDVEILKRKFELFGWNCFIINGHDFEEIEWIFFNRRLTEKPIMIIADTIKGKGVSFMENGIKWHHSVPSEEEYKIAKKELMEN